MKKNITRLFSVLLAAVMVFGTLPVSAMGTDVADPPASTVDDAAVAASTAEPEESSVADETSDDAAQPEEQSAEEENAVTYASNDSFYKIVHLDCGRKYFSKGWIIALLYEMQNDGYNQLQLAFGNDGLRFLLDDMSFTANGTTYSHETVVSKVKAGNEAQNSSGDSSYLTETEMDEIIATANKLNIEIVPLLNLPGHANAILDIADDAYNASGTYQKNEWSSTTTKKSDNTLDVTSDAATEFATAIFKKYVDYFAKKDCRFFSFGADEYVNDLGELPAFSFSRLNSSEYASFVSFISNLADYIDSKGMTARAFNDGFYYSSQSMDESDALKKTQICYWSSGWGGYYVSSAETISNTHEMINTHGDFYYVLGKDDKFDSNYSYASNFTNTGFMSSTVTNPAGSMFCIWCDYPNAETETEVAQKTRLVLRAMAQRMDGQTVNVNDEVVENGFNADGSINGATDDSDIKISVGDSTEAATSGELTVGGNMVLHASKTVTWTTSDEDVATIASADETGVNSISNDSAVNASAINVTAAGVGSATITATDGEKTAEFTVTVQETETEDITVSVGATTDTYTVNGKYEESETYETENVSIAKVASVKAGSGYSLVTNGPVQNGTYYVAGTETGDKIPVTITKQSSGKETYYTVTSNDETVTLGSSDKKAQLSIALDASGQIKIYRKSGGDNYYYATVSDGKLVGGSSRVSYDSIPSLYLFTKTGESSDTIEVTFKGVSEGTTYATIGDTKFTITVTAEDLSTVDPLTVEYWITNKQVEADNATSKEILAAAAYGEKGKAFSELVPPVGITTDGEEHPTLLWKSTRLSAANKQTKDSGDMTLKGTDFEYVRYWGGKWWFSADQKSWDELGAGEQVVAYYMQRTAVTEEVTTAVVDWGSNYGGVTWRGGSDSSFDIVELDFAVKYENGSVTPTSFPVKDTTSTDSNATKTMEFHAHDNTKKDGNKYRRIGRVNAIETKDYEVYMITLTPTSDNVSNKLFTGNQTRPISYQYSGTEKVVWVDDSANLGDFADENKKAEQFTVGGEPSIEYIDIYANQGMLVTYYVRAKVTEDSLTVNYVDKNTGTDFYNYSIAVASGTYFNANIGLNNPWKQDLVNGTVTNLQKNDITVSADLSTMPGISAGYRYADYTCTEVERSGDGKTVTLYYTFSTTAIFVVDFGTPVTIQLSDINGTLAEKKNNITKAAYSSAKNGKVTINDDYSVTFTPSESFESSRNGGQFSVTYTGSNLVSNKENGVSYTIYIYPASNVLYEEDFLTTEETGWTKSDNFDKHTTAQETQKVGGDESYSVFGYDVSYNSSVTDNGYWKMEKLNEKTSLGKALTTTFYGNIFDLIGSCDKDTGRILMAIVDPDTGKPVTNLSIDTRYNGGAISQVPLAHVELDTEKTYRVDIYATELPATNVTVNIPSSAAAVALYADEETSEDEALNEFLETYGITLADVEFVSVSDNLASSEDAISTAALIPDEGNSGSVVIKHEAGTHVEIDGFRVYRSTATSDENETPTVADNYPVTEQNVNYWNILDVIKGSITAYTESSNEYTVDVQQYENAGGPQNEIYLAGGRGVAFRLTDTNITSVQVSLRAVSGSTEYNSTTINSNTEMYYSVNAQNGIFTITNTGDSLLAIGNVKLPSSVTADKIQDASTISNAELATAIQLAIHGAEEPEVFAPDTFTAKTTATNVVRKKVVTLKVTVSSDVAYVTINGVKYTRTGFQSAFNKNRTILVVNTVPKNETKTYEIVAYNADGVASETKTVTG